MNTMTRSIRPPMLLLLALAAGCGRGEPESTGDPTEQTAAASPAAAAPASPAREEAAAPAHPSYACDAIERNHQCYTVTPLPMLVTGVRAGCQTGAGGQWSEGGSCPSEDVVATCRKDQNQEVRYYYRGVDLERAETACTSFGGAWEEAS